MTVQEVAETKCFTGFVEGLTLQIIDELNVLIPNTLVSFSDLRVQLNTTAVNPFVQPKAKAALAAAIEERNTTLRIASAYRTVAQQYLLRFWKDHRPACGITFADTPSHSNHENGLSLDIPTGSPGFDLWITALSHHGWVHHPTDRPHFTFHSAGGINHEIASVGVKAFQTLWNKHNPADLLTVDGVYGDATETRLKKSPADGFDARRFLMLTQPTNMSGPDVVEVQNKLAAASIAVQVTGNYDVPTEAAVRQFQESAGLKVDGVVGPMTRLALGIPA